METKQQVPDFLQQYIPEGGDLKFEPDTDEELENQKNGGGGGDGAWGDSGAGGGDVNAGDANAGDAWGAPAANDPGSIAKDADSQPGSQDWGAGNAASGADSWGAGTTGGGDTAW